MEQRRTWDSCPRADVKKVKRRELEQRVGRAPQAVYSEQGKKEPFAVGRPSLVCWL